MKFCLSIVLSILFLAATAKDGNVPASIYDFKVRALDGSVIDFSQFHGKKILIVNTPEEMDYARQYAELDALYKKYKDKLVIVGFLANDFQIEPGSKKNPAVPKHYDVSFPLAAKVMVRGNDMAPVFQWLTQKKYNNFKDNEVGFDFQKYLIDGNGKLVAIFDPKTRASDQKIVSAVEK